MKRRNELTYAQYLLLLSPCGTGQELDETLGMAAGSTGEATECDESHSATPSTTSAESADGDGVDP
jgi:hypothetical protein